MKIIDITDIAVLVTDSSDFTEYETRLIHIFKEKNIPYIVCFNKADLYKKELKNQKEIAVSTLTGEGIEEIKKLLGTFSVKKENSLLSDLILKGDTIILVMPIDGSAPKGRIILPQQMVIRDILDSGAVAVSLQPDELEPALENMKKKPKMVICDSQVFGKIKGVVPADIYLTSFSILMLRYKLGIEAAFSGIKAIDKLKDGDKILISEGCTHHRQCEDIGTVKIPGWLKEYTGKKLEFEFTSGGEFPDNVKRYALVIHCGACMLTDAAVKARKELCEKSGVPFTNYGLVISKINGITERALEIFGNI